LIEGHEVNSGTQFNVFAQEFGHLCNLQSLFDHHEPRSDVAPVPRDEPLCRQPRTDAGRVSRLSGSAIRNTETGRELSMMRRGMPPPSFFGTCLLVFDNGQTEAE
jgi:hypothetical protein